MDPKSTPISDERAVESGQVGQPAHLDVSRANVGYYEPHKLADLAKNGRLYIIADGVSGAASGQMASQYAIQKILHNFYSKDILDPQTRLLEAIQLVNRDIFERSNQFPERRPLATTLTAALIHNNKLLIANVGDNLAYVAWGQDIEPVTWDASSPPPAEPDDAPVLLLPAQAPLPTESKVKKAKPDSHSERVPQVLGLEKNVKIDTFTRRLFPADIVILCSGGAAGYITDKEIARAVGRHAPEQAVPRLIALASERGNRDPIAISVARILSSAVALRPPKSMPLPSAPNWSDWEDKPSSSTPTKPVVPKTESGQTTTQPLPVATPTPSAALSATQTQPLAAAKKPDTEKTQTPPSYIQQQQKREWRWGGCILGLLLVLFACALPVISWQYFVTDEMLVSVPYYSNVEAAITGAAGSMGIDLSAEEVVESESADPAEVAQDTSAETPSGQTVTLIETAASEATVTLQLTAATENNSPVATPEAAESAFNSPVSTPTAAPSPTPESLPTPVPTPTLVPLPTIELPEGCENRGRFRRDVTIPDGTQFGPGEAFEKTWLLSNADTCPWGPGYTVRHIGGDIMGGSPQVPLTDVVAPDTNGEISVPLIAPSSPGQYRGEWQLHDLNGEAFGPELYLEIEVVPGALADVTGESANILYDFVENADQASWSSGSEPYTLIENDVEESLELPFPQGLVARGSSLLRGNVQSQGDVLLTYPHWEVGSVEGSYPADTSLEPTDALVLEIGFPKLSILSDDGVTFEVAFTPVGGSEQIIISRPVLYQDSPVSEVVSLSTVESGQTGTFTLRVLGGNSLNQDWAVWINAQVIRP